MESVGMKTTSRRDLATVTREQGFTVFEVLVAILIVILTCSFAVAGLASLNSSAEKHAAKNSLAADIQRARSEADQIGELGIPFLIESITRIQGT